MVKIGVKLSKLVYFQHYSFGVLGLDKLNMSVAVLLTFPFVPLYYLRHYYLKF